jgi:integrase
VLLLAFHAGLRACEIRGLRVCDVDLGANLLRVRQAVSHGVVDTPKSGHDREVPLTRALREALAAAIEGRPRDARVALSTRGRPWGQSGLREMFVRSITCGTGSSRRCSTAAWGRTWCASCLGTRTWRRRSGTRTRRRRTSTRPSRSWRIRDAR